MLNESNSSDDEKSQERYERFLTHFARHRESIFGYIFSLLPHQADADDVFQRTSLTLWRKYEQFDSERNFPAWACGIAFNEVRNFIRGATRSRLRFDADLIERLADQRTVSHLYEERRLSALQSCLEHLSDSDRKLIQLIYRSGMSVSEAAETVDSALQTAYNRLSKIRRSLLKCVQRKLTAEA